MASALLRSWGKENLDEVNGCVRAQVFASHLQVPLCICLACVNNRVMNDGKVACNNLKGRKRHADWSNV